MANGHTAPPEAQQQDITKLIKELNKTTEKLNELNQSLKEEKIIFSDSFDDPIKI